MSKNVQENANFFGIGYRVDFYPVGHKNTRIGRKFDLNHCPTSRPLSFPPEEYRGGVLRDFPGYKYKFATGQPSEGFAPNIGVIDEYAPVTLDDYVAGNLRMMPQMHEKMGGNPPKVLSQAEFVTDSNERGVRVITESEVGDKKIMRQIFYFFDGKNGNKFVVTCSALGAARESYDKLFDTSMKTFRAGRA